MQEQFNLLINLIGLFLDLIRKKYTQFYVYLSGRIQRVTISFT